MGAVLMIIVIFALPVATAAGFLVCAIRRRMMRRKNEASPGAYPDEALENCRITGKFCGVIALLSWGLLAGGWLLLRFGAIPFM